MVQEPFKKRTMLQAVVDHLATDQRRVAADWRILLILIRATREIPQSERRWRKVMDEPWQVRKWILQNVERDILRPLDECDSLFLLGKGVPMPTHTSPSATEVLIEANPSAALSHFTALHFHGLTEEMPGPIHLVIPYSKPEKIIPPGLAEEDLADLRPGAIECRRPDSIFNGEVIWHRLRPNRMVGLKDYFRAGAHLRVMSPERVLLEGLMTPEYCGGLSNIFKAWASAVDTMDLDHLFECAQSIESAVLRQRVGYLLERHGVKHQVLDHWATLAQPGGSSKLDPHAPFGSLGDYDERWKLAINAKVTLEAY